MSRWLQQMGCLLLLLAPLSVHAQDTEEKKISGIFSGLSFEEFAIQVENRSTYRFYYLQEDVGSLVVNVHAYQNSLGEILEVLFSGSNLHFSIDSQQRVFITKGKALRLNLAPGYFTIKKESPKEEEYKAASDSRREERIFAKNRLWEIGQGGSSGSQAILRGKVLSVASREPIIGAILYARDRPERTITSETGDYSIQLPKGRHTLIIQSFGAYQEQRQINLIGNGTLNIDMDDNIIALSEVVVTSEKSANIERPEMGVASISAEALKKIPAVLGEVDVLKGILTLPGVKTVGEASAGFNVRGGAADQNLILFNQATIYNPTHLFGMFSAFNPDLVESLDLYKAGIPVQFGGRLSSVLDVKAKFGDPEKISGGGGLGLMTSRLHLSGPLSKTTTFAVGGRTTYSNWLFDHLDEESEFRNSRASFYDLNLNLKQRSATTTRLLFFLT